MGAGARQRGPSGHLEPPASPLPSAPSLPHKAATNASDKGDFSWHLFIYYLFFMDDNLEGAGRAAGAGRGSQPLGTTSPLAKTQLPGLSRGPRAHPALGGGVGAALPLGGAGWVLTRVPPACAWLCQRGRVSSSGEGGRGHPGGEQGPCWGGGGRDRVRLCLPSL